MILRALRTALSAAAIATAFALSAWTVAALTWALLGATDPPEPPTYCTP